MRDYIFFCCYFFFPYFYFYYNYHCYCNYYYYYHCYCNYYYYHYYYCNYYHYYCYYYYDNNNYYYNISIIQLLNILEVYNNIQIPAETMVITSLNIPTPRAASYPKPAFSKIRFAKYNTEG